MKLGITVVYFVKKDEGWLIDLHLKYIRRYTDVPYKIYAAAERLLPEYRYKIENADDIVICKPGPTNEIAGKENSFYLEQLFQVAVDDGCTHIATFHVDSFPLQNNWAGYLSGKLEKGCQLAAIERAEENDHKPHSSFMFFGVDYYLKYKPALRLEEEAKNEGLYRKYLRRFPHVQDSGFGFGYQLYKDHLQWYRMNRSNKKYAGTFFGGIYDDLVFHLGGAGFTILVSRKDKIWYWRKEAVIKYIFKLLRFVRIDTRLLEKKYLPGFDKSKSRRRISTKNNAISKNIKERLLTDPDQFFNFVRKNNLKNESPRRKQRSIRITDGLTRRL